MANKGKLKVLYAEGDADVLAKQGASMEKAGHQVQTAAGRKAALAAFEQSIVNKNAFDLVILGATLTRDDRHHLPYMAKKAHRQTRVLVLHADGGRHPASDGFLDTGSSIESLLAKISSVMGIESPAFAMSATAGK
jgi:DNA-binding NtrC family response regulator